MKKKFGVWLNIWPNLWIEKKKDLQDTMFSKFPPFHDGQEWAWIREISADLQF